MRTLLVVATSALPTVLLAQGAIQPCSISSSALPSNGASYRPAVTPDGRWITFCSAASDLVAGDTNGWADVFVRDRLTGALERVSVDGAGSQANADSWAAGISDDDNLVVFLSLADNLVAGDTNGVMDAFLRDRSAGTTTRVSVGTGGLQSTGWIDSVAISGDGGTIAFTSPSALVADDTNGQYDVFVYTVATAAVERASVGTGGVQSPSGSFAPNLSADGRFVTFHSAGNTLVPGDSNGARDIFVRDRQNGTTARVSVATGGAQSNADSRYGSISADGRLVAFLSFASNLVPGDTNATGDVFVHDRATGTTDRVSVSSTGAQGTTAISSVLTLPVISASGRYVAFYSQLDGIGGPVNAQDDAFVHDRLTGETLQVSRSSTGAPGNAMSGPLAAFGSNWVLETMAMASDPPIAVFSTMAGNLFPADGNGVADVYAIDVGLRCAAAGPAAIGGAAVVDLAAPHYAQQLFVGTFSAGVASGVFLPGAQWLPLDDDPLLVATAVPFVTDAAGSGGWSVSIPSLPPLVGQSLHAAAVRLDFVGPGLFPAIGEVVTFVIQ
jgi:Tol biopolymer transport system component